MSVYLDHNATTALRPQAKAAMMAALEHVGNASSVHAHGQKARAVVEQARQEVAALVGALESKMVIFTSGATEANSCVLQHYKAQKTLISAIEHPSVIESSPKAVHLPVGQDGLIQLDTLPSLLEGAALVSVMLVNNETGVIQPIKEIAALARAAGARLHVDAVQAAGRMALDVQSLGADYVSISAHKMGGPMGVGALIVAPKAPPVKLIYGGGQERRQRAGTENVPAIAGFGAAARVALQDLAAFEALGDLRDEMEQKLAAALPHLIFFGQQSPRVGNTSCFAFPHKIADMQLMALDLAGFSVSSGSACSSGSVKPSHVLEAMGVAPDLAACALRVSLGWNTSADEIERFVSTYIGLSKNWM